MLRALRRREAGGGRAVSLGSSESCRRGVVEQLLEMHRNSVGYLRRDGLAAEDDQFYAEQNARLVADAEQYHGTMFAAHISSWNLRDTHMADGRQSPGPPPTPRGAREARRLGAQLPCRRCAADTDGRVRRTQPRPAHPIATPGRRETERQSHYFLARIASQFDAVIHLDETRAVEPLERTAGWEFGEPSETLSPGGLVSAGPAVALDVLRPTLLRGAARTAQGAGRVPIRWSHHRDSWRPYPPAPRLRPRVPAVSGAPPAGAAEKVGSTWEGSEISAFPGSVGDRYHDEHG